MLKNTALKYGLIAKIFHWLMSVGIIGLLGVGFIMTSIDASDFRWELYYWHKATGVLILSLLFLRVFWRLINIKLKLPVGMPNWQKRASQITHFLLYSLMFLMPISGILMSRFSGKAINVFNLFTIAPYDKNPYLSEFFNNFHSVTAFIFCGLIGLHILAALYHHFILKDDLLNRIIR